MSELAAIALAQGEVGRFGTEFSPNLILKHLKVAVAITDRRVIVRRPNTIFGLIAHGYQEQSSPLGHLAEFRAGEHTSTQKLVIGGGLTIFGLMEIFGSGLLGPLGVLMGLICLGVAAYFFLTAQTIGVTFVTTGGSHLHAPASKSERPMVEQARLQINSLLYSNASPAGPNIGY